jgi:methylphosphotriester-DNA--protein-cysteine methyltransferase
MKRYKLIGSGGTPYESATPGTRGGHRATRIYGRLDCPSALRAIGRGGYVTHRVFFADEDTAVAAGYRPCARCLPERYKAWKATASTTAAPPR